MSEADALPLGVSGALLDDREIRAEFTFAAELRAMLAFERTLAEAQASAGDLSAEALAAISAACAGIRFDEERLRQGIARDGLVVPALVEQLREAIGAPHQRALHLGGTSQDVIDTALMLRLKAACAILERRLAHLIGGLERFEAAHRDLPLMARTRMQDALPFTMADKLATWLSPLRGLAGEAPRHFPIQLGGPIGVRSAALGADPDRIAEHMAESLGLSPAARSWHTDRRPVLAICQWCLGLGAALGKFGLDVTLMTQTAIAELKVEGGVSSAMAHKNNPIRAELLVTLARFVAAQTAALQAAGLHENERSGANWSLEWLLVPQILLGTGTALLRAQELLETMTPADTR